MAKFGTDFGENVTSLGVVNEHGEPIAGVVFHNYQPWFGNIEVSFASDSAAWLTRNTLSEIMAYPFIFLKVKRVTGITPSDPTASVSRFVRRLGMTQEGRIRRGLGDDDAIIWGMLAAEWRFSRFNTRRPVIHGKAVASHPDRPGRRRKRAGRSQRADRPHAGLAQ
jgi:hypothetical protein